MRFTSFWEWFKMSEIKAIDKELVKKLLDQIGEHSGFLCHHIDELRATRGSVGSYAYDRARELEGLISDQNACIQEVLVSFHDLL